MARVTKKRHAEAVPHTALGQFMEEHLEWLLINNYSQDTADHARWSIADFIRWAEQRGIEHPMEVTRPILESYQRYLYYYRKGNGQPLTFRTQHSRLTPVRRWFRWLVRNNRILHNPASDLDLPRMEKRLPKTIFSADEVERVLILPDIATAVGLRDRAMLETFYSTGVRRKELVQLKLYNVDRERATLTIRQGKGKKDRMIPIGERALAWIEKYLREARPSLAVEPDDATLFLTQYGEPFHPDAMSNLARDYIAQANLGKSGSCHTFRHTMATLMLEGGADIRYIQQMLGHADLSTTEIYTHVAIRKLQQIHAATHPGALLEKKITAATSDAHDEDEQRAALLAALEADDEDEGNH
ncbi:MAG TPA: site-specific tyrosine recombinase XerC [Terriglobales bacterium]|jgi:integrase/recombinase XerD|nr:site-specific tyrosine recombinase XerC [Terriglobales bacterium]